MAVLVYLVGLLGESLTPAVLLHVVFTVTETPTDGLNSTVQVRVTELPAVIIPGGLLVMLTVGVGTSHRFMYISK